MKKIFYIIFIVFFSQQTLKCQQNIVVNGGFEEKDDLASNNKPNGSNEIRKCKGWDSKGSSLSDLFYADWYSTKTGYFSAKCSNRGCPFYFDDFATANDLSTYNGGNNQHFAGFSNSSQLWNNLSEKTIKNSYVKISCWISPRGFKETTFGVALRKPVILGQDKLLDIGFMTFDSDISSGHTPLHQACEWYYFESDWIKTDDEEYPQLLFRHSCGLEGECLAQCWDEDASYLYIDDVQLLTMECPPINCDQNWGDFNVSINESHNSSLPFLITGLSNVSFMKLHIYVNAAQDLGTIQITNPPNKIAWNGKDNFGNELANATYGYKLELENECKSDIRSGIFSKTETSGSSPFYNYTSVSRSVKECCMDDLTIQNQIIISDHTIGNIKYSAIKAITAGPNVQIIANNNNEEPNNVLFEAGAEIILLPGFTTEVGAEFVAQIISCNPIPLMLKNSVNQDFSLMDYKPSINEESNESVSEEGLILTTYPNPVSDNVSFNFSISELGSTTIMLMNLQGKEMIRLMENEQLSAGTYEITYNVEDYQSGIYYYIIQAGIHRKAGKITVIR